MDPEIPIEKIQSSTGIIPERYIESCPKLRNNYPLVNIQKTMENHHFKAG